MDDIDCTKVLHALYEFLDGELTSERRQHIELHLNGCPHCFSAFDFEAELRIVVRSRLRAEVPPALRTRIAQALEREGYRPPTSGPGSGLGSLPVYGAGGSGGFGSGGVAPGGLGTPGPLT
jgi:anti-sigma factor (TIGR02949 family)